MDYASRLGASLSGLKPPVGTPMGGYKISAAGANVTPDQQSILDVIVGLFNNPSVLENQKVRGPK